MFCMLQKIYCDSFANMSNLQNASIVAPNEPVILQQREMWKTEPSEDPEFPTGIINDWYHEMSINTYPLFKVYIFQ